MNYSLDTYVHVFSQRKVQHCHLKNYYFEAKKRNSLVNACLFLDSHNYVVFANCVIDFYLCDDLFRSLG